MIGIALPTLTVLPSVEVIFINTNFSTFLTWRKEGYEIKQHEMLGRLTECNLWANQNTICRSNLE